MKRLSTTTAGTTLWLLGIWFAALSAAGQDRLSELLAKITDGPVDQADLYKLEGQPSDPKLIAALETAFDHHQTKEDKQLIAETLVRLDAASPKYFEFLGCHGCEYRPSAGNTCEGHQR